ncbi:MAG: ATP-binding protein [Bdellovibrionales bacterium]|nr:ATP-binding protein [Bdellovibrionales bacterium]
MKTTKFIVITGGPGAGKTAILETIKKMSLPSTVVLPEAASIIFNGGFWRLPSITAKASAQRAIYYIQKEMETLAREEQEWNFALCDRGSLDGLAYWPYKEELFWNMSNSDLKSELSKYSAVIHLRTPPDNFGYNHQNPLRVESAEIALEIDNKIALVWKEHPNYRSIDYNKNFLTKAEMAIDHIKSLQKNI